MPELPEVETVVRDLVAHGLEGRRIARARVLWPGSLNGAAPREVERRLAGARIERLSRRAKYIVARLSAGRWLLIHLRMTGRLELASRGTPARPHTRAALAGRDRMLKPLLLDQRVIAGIGNIYADESLWDARLHPRRRSGSLTPPERLRLYRAIRRVLRRGVAALGTSLGNGSTNFYSVAGRRGRNQDGLRVFRRTGRPCPRCGLAVVREVVAQRSTHLCPRCQPGPRARPRGAPSISAARR